MDLDSLLPILSLAAGAIIVLALMAFAFAGPSPERAKLRRLKGLGERHGASANLAVEAQIRRITAARATRADLAITRLLPNPAALKKRLGRTGKSWTIGQYGMVSLGLTAFAMLALTVVGMPLLLSLLVALFVGLGIPHFIVGYFITRRVTKFNTKFPDAIELLVRGLRSGLPIAETMQVVGAEVEGPVGVEFRSITDKMKIGRSMDVALQETADRLDTAEFQFFCITIAIQRETGGNLAETLANLATVLRQRMQMKLKIKAMSSESKASAYIIGSLPFIVFVMIWTINTSYMQQFFIDQRLMVAGIGGLVWMGIGAFIMARMINFEI